MTDVIVIGGGAAGMTAAIFAAENGAKTVIAERNDRLGWKLSITGKGRCNVTNNCGIDTVLENIPRNGRFLYSALSRFEPKDVMAWFESMGVPLKTERGRRVFPVSDKAGDVVKALSDRLRALNVGVVRAKATSLIIEDGECKGILCGNTEYRARAVILATGGMSYPRTGSDGFGYTLARSAGHTVISPEPSLSAMTTERTYAAGLNLRNISMKLLDGKKTIYEDFGELLFTESGISGPTVLSASALIPRMERGRYSAVIDLKPALSEKQLDARVLRDFGERRGRAFSQSLDGLLPSKLAGAIVELSEIPPDKRTDEITSEERKRLVRLLKAFRMEITGFRPIDEAIVTRGGVSVKEISPQTMESKLCPGLYFAGEIIDTDGYTGGFNLQIAFSTGRAAGIAAAGSKKNQKSPLQTQEDVL